MLPPHIAEESEQREDELELAMRKEDQTVQGDLAVLSGLKDSKNLHDIEQAAATYARFSTLRSQIIALSRENTNVFSLALSLNQKRKIAAVCQDNLAALQQAVQVEPTLEIPYGGPARPK